MVILGGTTEYGYPKHCRRGGKYLGSFSYKDGRRWREVWLFDNVVRTFGGKSNEEMTIAGEYKTINLIRNIGRHGLHDDVRKLYLQYLASCVLFAIKPVKV